MINHDVKNIPHYSFVILSKFNFRLLKFAVLKIGELANITRDYYVFVNVACIGYILSGELVEDHENVLEIFLKLLFGKKLIFQITIIELPDKYVLMVQSVQQLLIVTKNVRMLFTQNLISPLLSVDEFHFFYWHFLQRNTNTYVALDSYLLAKVSVYFQVF